MSRLFELISRIFSSRLLPWALLVVSVAVSAWLAWPLLDAPDDAIRTFVTGTVMAVLLALVIRALHGQAMASQRAMESAQLRHLSSEENMRAIFDASIDGIIMIDHTGVVRMFNSAAERLFGYSAAKVLGRNVSMLMPSPYREQHDHYLQRYLVGGEAKIIGLGREVEGQRKDGSVFPMRLAVSEIKGSGQPRFVGMVQDITQQKRTEALLTRYAENVEQSTATRIAEMSTAREAAETANRTKSAFFASMSHELRTPLHAILSFSALGQEKLQEASPEKLRQYLEKISVAGTRMLSLVSDLLDISRLEAGKMVFSFARHDLRQIAVETASELHGVADAKQITLEIEPPSCAVEVECDAQRIGQVLRNLLANAIHFSPLGGTIAISMASTNLPGRRASDHAIPALCISVADEGPGISADELETIFDEFVQSKNAKSTGGTGLGLAICRHILNMHHGRIWAENRAEGGACMRFSLPCHLSQPAMGPH
jgi:two-component system sensor kinase FixL